MSANELKQWEAAALRWLAVRDYSQHELVQKLRQRFECDTESLAPLIARLQALSYLDDWRFTQTYLRVSAARGRGLQRIIHDLRDRGINAELIHQAIAETEVNWLQLAREQRNKKFGNSLPTEFKERARQSRFLAGRGFSMDTIKAVFQYHSADD